MFLYALFKAAGCRGVVYHCGCSRSLGDLWCKTSKPISRHRWQAFRVGWRPDAVVGAGQRQLCGGGPRAMSTNGNSAKTNGVTGDTAGRG